MFGSKGPKYVGLDNKDHHHKKKKNFINVFSNL